MRSLTSLIASTVCIALISSGAGADDRKRPARSPTSTSEQTRATTTLSPAGEGRRAFLKYNCSGCHGDRAGGGMGPNIQHAEGDDVSEAVREGEEEGMPSYRRILTSTEISNIAIYLRSIGTTSEPVFYDWWLPVPPK